MSNNLKDYTKWDEIDVSTFDPNSYTDAITIEELYQAFKERMLAEKVEQQNRIDDLEINE